MFAETDPQEAIVQKSSFINSVEDPEDDDQFCGQTHEGEISGEQKPEDQQFCGEAMEDQEFGGLSPNDQMQSGEVHDGQISGK